MDNYELFMKKQKALDAFAIGYDLGVQAAKAIYEKKGGKDEN